MDGGPKPRPTRIRLSSKPYKHTRRRKTLSTRASHRISTCFSQGKSGRRTGEHQQEPCPGSCWITKERPFAGRVRSPPRRGLQPLRLLQSAQRYGLPLSQSADSTAFFSHARAEDRKLGKDLTFGGPCFEGTLQKPTGVSESSPVAGTIEGFHPSKTLDAGRARELQKSAQPATQMLSMDCL